MQNIVLAARALGLGATLTTLYQSLGKDADAALGPLEDAYSYAIPPIGYPLVNLARRSTRLEDMVFADRWGEKWSRE